MRQCAVVGALVLLVTGAAAASPPALRVAGPLSPRIASYRIAADLDATRHVITAREHLTWRNAEAVPARELALHLYMNAFKNERTVFMREARGGEGRRTETPTRWGAIDVTSIRLGERELRPQARLGRCGEDEPARDDCPRDETVMTVPLPTPVEPGGVIELDLTFQVQLPPIVLRTGYHGTFTMVGQWFPKIGVFEPTPDGGARWNCHAFHANSEFFADFGTYDVELTVPTGHVVGATGVRVAERVHGGRTTYRYHAEDVHDFAWVADPTFRVARDRYGDVELLLLYHPGSERGVARQLAAVKAAFAWLEPITFPYPYTGLTIVEPPLGGRNAGEMEYPTLITTEPGFIAHRPSLERTAFHELAHQYWYGMIASNEFEEPWLDEGVTSYATALMLEERFGEPASFRDLLGLVGSDFAEHRRGYAGSPDVDALETYAWRFAPRQYWLSYSKTTVALRTLEGYLGRERMLSALGDYARAWRFRHPRAQDFFDSFAQSTGEDLGWFFRPAFLGTEVLDYEILEVGSEPRRGPTPVWDSRVIVHRRGDFVFPVEVEATFEDGHVERRGWDGRDRWRRFAFTHSTPLRAATVDPDAKIPLDVDLLNNGRYRRPARAPARRMQLGLAFILQSLLGLVGP